MNHDPKFALIAALKNEKGLLRNELFLAENEIAKLKRENHRLIDKLAEAEFEIERLNLLIDRTNNVFGYLLKLNENAAQNLSLDPQA